MKIRGMRNVSAKWCKLTVIYLNILMSSSPTYCCKDDGILKFSLEVFKKASETSERSKSSSYRALYAA